MQEEKISGFDSVPILPAVYSKKESGNLNFFTGFAKYYILKSPFYLIGGVGRNFGGQNRTIDYYYLSLDSRGNFYTSDYFQLKKDISPYNYILGGVGIDWIFSNGLILGAEFSIPQAINKKNNTNISLLPLTRSGLTLGNLNDFYYRNIITNSDYKSNFPVFYLWIGYAF